MFNGKPANTGTPEISAKELASFEAFYREKFSIPAEFPFNWQAQGIQELLTGWTDRAGRLDEKPSSITISGYQLREAMAFLAPDNDPNLLGLDLMIEHRCEDAHFREDDDGPMPGLYAYHADCPEEGAVMLAGTAAIEEAPARINRHERTGFRFRLKNSPDSEWSYIHHRAPDSFELRESESVVALVADDQRHDAAESTDAQLFQFGCDHGFPEALQQTSPEVGPVFWTYDPLLEDSFPTARAAMVAQFKKHQQQAQGAQSCFLADSLLSASSMQKQELPAKPEPHKLNPEWLEELLDAADLVISNDTFKTEEEHRDLTRYVANLSKLANAVRQSPASLLAGLVPAAYADLQAFKNFQAGVASREWMWAQPDPGLVAMYIDPIHAPSVETVAGPLVDENDLVAIARSTGLRQYLHGINATFARKLLADFVAALPPAKDAQLLEDFFRVSRRITVEHAANPVSAHSCLLQQVTETAARLKQTIQSEVSQDE